MRARARVAVAYRARGAVWHSAPAESRQPSRQHPTIPWVAARRASDHARPLPPPPEPLALPRSVRQAGFIGFIVKPLFTAVCDWLPVLRPLAFKEIEANAAEWVDGSERSLAQEGRPFALPEHVAWDSTTSTWIVRPTRPAHPTPPQPRALT